MTNLVTLPFGGGTGWGMSFLHTLCQFLYNLLNIRFVLGVSSLREGATQPNFFRMTFDAVALQNKIKTITL